MLNYRWIVLVAPASCEDVPGVSSRACGRPAGGLPARLHRRGMTFPALPVAPAKRSVGRLISSFGPLSSSAVTVGYCPGPGGGGAGADLPRVEPGAAAPWAGLWASFGSPGVRRWRSGRVRPVAGLSGGEGRGNLVRIPVEPARGAARSRCRSAIGASPGTGRAVRGADRQWAVPSKRGGPLAARSAIGASPETGRTFDGEDPQ